MPFERFADIRFTNFLENKTTVSKVSFTYDLSGSPRPLFRLLTTVSSSWVFLHTEISAVHLKYFFTQVTYEDVGQTCCFTA